MIELKIAEKTYEVPNRWDEVTIKQYQQIIKIVENSEYTVSGRVKVLQLLSVIPKDVIDRMDINQFNEIMSKFEFITEEIPDIGDVSDKVFKINNKEYKLMDFNKLSLGQWVDLDLLIKEPLANLHKIMAIMLICEDETEYDIDKSEIKAKQFKNELTALDAMKFLTFFLTSKLMYVKHTVSCLVNKLTKKEREELTRQIGDGWVTFMD